MFLYLQETLYIKINGMEPILKELPDFYSKILPDFFNTSIPKEKLATCNACAMCHKKGDLKMATDSYYLPSTKCCTYHPIIPNYLVGGILQDKNPLMNEGRKRIRDRIKSKHAITPKGIIMPKKYEAIYKLTAKSSFGKTESLLCPFYEKKGGLCTVWKFRNSICSTWFCKTVAGEDGKLFWQKLGAYLGDVEMNLGNYCSFSLGIDPDKIIKDNTVLLPPQLEDLTLEDVNETYNEEDYKKYWGVWVGKEEEYYIRAFDIISKLSKSEFEKITGTAQMVNLKKLENAYEKMMYPILPGKLKRNVGIEINKLADGSYNLALGAALFNLPDFAYEILMVFDGALTNKEVILKALNEKNIELEEDFLIGLYQNRFLIEA